MTYDVFGLLGTTIDNRYPSGGTCKTGSYSSGDDPFGLRDMEGNVSQWTTIAYCPYDSAG